MAHRQNYTAKMELNRQNRISAGQLSERFPEVSGIVICMTYYQKGINPVLMQRTINLIPGDSAYLNMECVIKGCVDGGFDLTPVIANMVKTRRRDGKGNLACHGTIDTLASDHASVGYEIEIQYKSSQ